jgi:hypothetical protein
MDHMVMHNGHGAREEWFFPGTLLFAPSRMRRTLYVICRLRQSGVDKINSYGESNED